MIRKITERIECASIIPHDDPEVDANATMEAYIAALEKDYSEYYPDAELDIREGIGRSSVDADTEEEENEVEDTGRAVYERGGFYVLRDGSRV